MSSVSAHGSQRPGRDGTGSVAEGIWLFECRLQELHCFIEPSCQSWAGILERLDHRPLHRIISATESPKQLVHQARIVLRDDTERMNAAQA